MRRYAQPSGIDWYKSMNGRVNTRSSWYSGDVNEHSTAVSTRRYILPLASVMQLRPLNWTCATVGRTRSRKVQRVG